MIELLQYQLLAVQVSGELETGGCAAILGLGKGSTGIGFTSGFEVYLIKECIGFPILGDVAFPVAGKVLSRQRESGK